MGSIFENKKKKSVVLWEVQHRGSSPLQARFHKSKLVQRKRNVQVADAKDRSKIELIHASVLPHDYCLTYSVQMNYACRSGTAEGHTPATTAPLHDFDLLSNAVSALSNAALRSVDVLVSGCLLYTSPSPRD